MLCASVELNFAVVVSSPGESHSGTMLAFGRVADVCAPESTKKTMTTVHCAELQVETPLACESPMLQLTKNNSSLCRVVEALTCLRISVGVAAPRNSI